MYACFFREMPSTHGGVGGGGWVAAFMSDAVQQPVLCCVVWGLYLVWCMVYGGLGVERGYKKTPFL